MKSGLEGRNNIGYVYLHGAHDDCLNEVRPGRPEQLHLSKLIFTSKNLSQ